MSRLISHLELSTCSRARKQCSDDAALDHSSSSRGRAHATRTRGDSQRWGVTMANISDVLHGLRTVRSALKQLHRSYPETIFFVVPATAALFSTIALGCISLASVVQNQVWKHAARSTTGSRSAATTVSPLSSFQLLLQVQGNECAIVGGIFTTLVNGPPCSSANQRVK